MKYCRSCGKELNDSANFCTSCGTKCIDSVNAQRQSVGNSPYQNSFANNVQTQTNHKSSRKASRPKYSDAAQNTVQGGFLKKKKPKKSSFAKKFIRFIAACIVLAIFVGAAVSGIWLFATSEGKVIRALYTQEYDTASKIIKNDYSAAQSTILIHAVRWRIGEIKKDFTKDRITFSSALAELDSLSELGISGILADVNNARSALESLDLSKEHFEKAEQFYSSGVYTNAIVYYRLVSEDDPNYRLAKKNAAEAEKQYREQVINISKDCTDSISLSEAIATLYSALDLLPNDTKIIKQISICEEEYSKLVKSDTLTAAKSYADKNDYKNAVLTLKTLIDSDMANTEITSTYNSYCFSYVSQSINQANNLITAKKFDEALTILSETARYVPDNATLANKIAEVKELQPLPISSLTPVVSDYWGQWNTADAKDTFGNDYSSACNYMKLGEWSERDHYAEYRLYGKYTTLTGSIVPHSDSNKDRISYLQIYVDDRLVYTSQDINRKTDPIDFSINVSGADYVKINVHTEYVAFVILYDVQLWQ